MKLILKLRIILVCSEISGRRYNTFRVIHLLIMVFTTILHTDYPRLKDNWRKDNC